MSFSHLYYTSAKTNISGGNGFGVYSLSNDVTPEEVEEIKKYCTYMQPQTLANTVDQESVLHLYPKAFSYYKLSSGRVAMSATHYVGKDYSGRSGNFFTHTVIFDEVRLQKNRPIQYVDSASFTEKLTEEENNSTMQPVSLQKTTQFSIGTAISYEVLQQFISQDNRAQLLAKMVETIIQYPTTMRKLVIADEAQHIVKWIAAIQFCFPERLAKLIPFITYTVDPLQQQVMIAGMLADERNLSKYAVQTNLFQVKHGVVPSIEAGIYAKTVVDQLIVNEDALRRFTEFVETVKLEAIDNKLDGILPLYRFVFNRFTELQVGDLQKAISLYNSFTENGVLEFLTKEIAKNWAASETERAYLIEQIPLVLIEPFAMNLIGVSKMSANDAIKNFAVELFLQGWIKQAEHVTNFGEVLPVRKFYEAGHQLLQHDKVYKSYNLSEAYTSYLDNAMTENSHTFLWTEIMAMMLNRIYEVDPKLENQENLSFLLDYLESGTTNGFDTEFVLQKILKTDTFLRLIKLLFVTLKENEADLKRTLTTLNRIVKQHPELSMKVQVLLKDSGFVRDLVVEEQRERIVHGGRPIDTLLRFVNDEQALVKWSADETDELTMLAGHTLLQQQDSFLEELTLLWSDEAFVKRLEKVTNDQLIAKAEHLLLKTDRITQYEEMLTKWTKFMRKEFQEKRPNSELLIALIAINKEEYLNGLLFNDLSLALGEIDKTQHEELLRPYVPMLLTKVQRFDTDAKQLIQLLMLLYKEKLFIYIPKSNQNYVKLMAHYLLVVHEKKFDYEEMGVPSILNQKAFEKELKAYFKEIEQVQIYQALVSDTKKGSENGFFSKVLGKFTGNKNGDQK